MSHKYGKKGAWKRKQNRRMVPLLLGLGGLALIVLAGLSLWGGARSKAAIEVTGAPALKVDQEYLDLGDVKLGQVVKVSFDLSNVGDQTLRFGTAPYVEVKEGCWPPLPAIGSMVLKPGESTTLSMEFMMHGEMGGKHDFRVHLASNDPQAVDRELTVLSNWIE